MSATPFSVVNAVAATGNKSRRHHLHLFQRGKQSKLTHEELDARAADLAARLADAGLRRGDRIAVLARNGLEWLVLDLAAIKGGFITAGFEFGRMKLTPAQLQEYGVRAIYAEPLAPGVEALDLRPLIADSLETPLASLKPAPAAPHYQPSDTTTIKFTSGSTGQPKGLAATVGSIDSSIAAVQTILDHRDGDNLLVFLPLSLLQQRYWVYSALAHGHDVTVAPFEFALEAAQKTHPTVIMGVPGFYESLKRQVERIGPEAGPQARRDELRTLLGPNVRYMWTGSAPAHPDTLAFFDEAGLPLLEGYGMNETCIVSKNCPGAHRRGSVGRLLPGVKARIDADGMLIVSREHPVNTRYLFCAPGDSERIFAPNGDVRTGDLARFDEDGYLYILGRADDVVVLSNGKNVYSRPIVERVKQHAAVADCVLYGAGKPYIVALVSPTDEQAPSREAIAAHVQAVNRELSPDERIGKVFVAPQRFSIENGLLTSQFKPKRGEIFRTYASEINELYGVTA